MNQYGEVFLEFRSQSDVASNLENLESDTFLTVSGQNPDTVEDDSCGHYVAHLSEGADDDTSEAGLGPNVPGSESHWANLPDDLKAVVASWAELPQEVRDSILSMISEAIDPK